MLQPDLHFGIGIPAFWEENQVMKTNMFVHFKRTALCDTDFWPGRHCTGPVHYRAEIAVIKQLQTSLILSTTNNEILFFLLENTTKKDNLKNS